MIVSRVFSGLGNQMFQYAIARSISLKNKTQAFLDISAFTEVQLRAFGLNSFNLNCELVRNFEKPFISRIGWDFLKIKKFAFHYYNDLVWEFNHDLYTDRSTYIHLNGYWPWPKYFDSISGVLKADFILKDDLKNVCRQWFRAAETTNSVAIHIRRSDYVSDSHAAGFFGALDISYYRKAIDFIKTQTNDPYYFLFSDDPEWVQQHFVKAMELTNYRLVKDKCFIDPAQELYLMSSCKHNIIANSTFSWWGAWLNQNPGKIVIRPETWYRDEVAQHAYKNGILHLEGSIKL